jgi:hypothetical protein
MWAENRVGKQGPAGGDGSAQAGVESLMALREFTHCNGNCPPGE